MAFWTKVRFPNNEIDEIKIISSFHSGRGRWTKKTHWNGRYYNGKSRKWEYINTREQQFRFIWTPELIKILKCWIDNPHEES